MRSIDKIIIHCSATKEGKDFSAADIDTWHKKRGFRCIGYHFVITLDGRLQVGRPVEEIGAHVSGHNQHSIGICYIGGLDKNGKAKDTRTAAQKESMYKLLRILHSKFPKATIHGHREFANKACPCFNVLDDPEIAKIFQK